MTVTTKTEYVRLFLQVKRLATRQPEPIPTVPCVQTKNGANFFERQGEHIVKLLDEGNLDTIIEKYKDPTSPYFPLINDISYLNFAQSKISEYFPKKL